MVAPKQTVEAPGSAVVPTVQTLSGERATSPFDTSKTEAIGDLPIGAFPGSTLAPNLDIEIEGLGNIMEFPTDEEIASEEGVGPFCVVKTDYFAGSGGIPLYKGNVVRLSRLVNGYTDKKVARELIKQSVRRLFEVSAVRLADPDEIASGVAIVTEESENPTFRAQKLKNTDLEIENAALKERLAALEGGNQVAVPGPPASDDDAFEG